MDKKRDGPLISTEDEETKSKGGFLSTFFGVVFWLLIIGGIYKYYYAGDSDTDTVSTATTPQAEQTIQRPAVDMPQVKSYSVTIVLDYEEVPLTTNSPMYICIDGQRLGRQDAGTKEEYFIVLDEGVHKFYLENATIYSTEKISFYVSERNTSFNFGARTRLTFGMDIWEYTNGNEKPTQLDEQERPREVKERASVKPKYANLLDAAKDGTAKDVEQTLLSGAKVNAQNSKGDTALLIASRTSRLEVIKVLLDAGADVNIANKSGATPLSVSVYYAPSVLVTKILLQAGAKVNVKDKDGDTPLTNAVLSKKCSPDVIKTLVQAGADVNAKNKKGKSALDLAKKAEIKTILKQK